MKFLLLCYIFSLLLPHQQVLAQSANGFRDYQKVAPIQVSDDHKLKQLMAARQELKSEKIRLEMILNRQLREIKLIQDVGANGGLHFQDYFLTPEALPGAVLYIATLIATPILRKRWPMYYEGTTNIGTIITMAAGLGAIVWSGQELAEYNHRINTLEDMSDEDIKLHHDLKAAEYNRNLEQYNLLHKTYDEIQRQIDALTIKKN